MSGGIRTRVFVGSQEILRCPEVSVEFKRHAPLSRASVTLPDAYGEQFRAAMAGDAVELHYGYRGENATIWRGTVAWIKHGTKDQVRLGCVGEERPLSSTTIKQSWMDETPEAIIRWAIGQSGLPVGRIDSPGCQFPRFVASSVSVAQLARQCELTCSRQFGIDMSRWALWMDAGGLVNWGDFDEAGGPLISIATGAGLISHLPAADTAGLNRVETFLVPGLRDAMPFSLTDTRRGISGSFRAQHVRHQFRDVTARTFIWYHLEGVEYGGY